MPWSFMSHSSSPIHLKILVFFVIIKLIIICESILFLINFILREKEGEKIKQNLKHKYQANFTLKL